MDVKRTLLLVVVGGALAVWFAAAATPTPKPMAPLARPKTDAIDRSAVELAVEITRLHERLRPSASPLQSRDLFRYSAPAAPPRPDPVASQPAAVDPPRPVVPPLKLVGIAEDAGDAGPTRTAIISGFGALFLVKDGEAVTDRYRVTRVSSDAVELLEIDDNTTVRLALK
jgi:hypothetical protein